MNSSIYNVNLLQGLFKRFLFSIMALIIYRLGSYVTIPGINVHALQEIISNYQKGFFGVFNVFSGGALGRMTIFALNVMPYIIASIIFQLLSVSFPSLKNLRSEGEAGRKKINFYIRCVTVLFCIVQGSFIVMGLQNMNSSHPIILKGSEDLFVVIAVITLIGGSMFLIWLGEQITINGIGNGISLIIFTGIVAELPSSVSSFFMLGKVGELSIFTVLFAIIFVICLLWLIVFFEQSYRKVNVNYPRKQVNSKVYASNTSYIPLKMNMSGVIPPIFANALLLLPVTIANFAPENIVSENILLYFSHGSPLYILLHIILIIFFCFFYVGFVFNSEETAKNIQRDGGFVLGNYPGKATSLYFNRVIFKITILGSLYLSFICVIPEIIYSKYALSFAVSGTSLLIIVNVITDVFLQIQAYFLTKNYDQLNSRFK